MSELTQCVLGAALLWLAYVGWRSLSDFAAGRVIQVSVAGCIVGALALGLGYFIFNCTNAIIVAVDAGNVGAATFFVVTGVAALLFYGLLLFGVWIAFARYAKTKLNVELPGQETRLY